MLFSQTYIQNKGKFMGKKKAFFPLILRAEELVFLYCGVGEDSWESLGLQGDPTSLS